LAEVRLSYAEQFGAERRDFSEALKIANVLETFAAAPHDFRFAAAVAEFSEILRHSRHNASADFHAVEEVASAATEGDALKGEFVDLVGVAERLW
jgi:Ca-activated chloride channel family protein